MVTKSISFIFEKYVIRIVNLWEGEQLLSRKNYLDKDYEFDGYISDMISFEILENITFFLMEYLNSWCHHLKCLALGFLIKSKYFMSTFHIYIFDFPVFIKFEM